MLQVFVQLHAPSSTLFLTCSRTHHEIKLLVVDLAVAVNINVVYEALDLIVFQLLSEVHHDEAQLLAVDEPVAVAVKDIERLADLVLGVVVRELLGHHLQEGGKLQVRKSINIGRSI
jgi:hypothetical protein